MHPFLSLPSPWLIAHRGGSALAPENTLAAFAVAAELGADAVETDVRLTRDGVVVVFHDETTERITGAPGTVEGRTLAELRTLDGAFGFTQDAGRTFPRRGTGVAIPTFAEALARHPAMRFIVDAKSEDPALAQALAEAVRASGAERRVCVGSFFDAQSERLGALLPGCARYLPQQAATCHVLAALSGGDASACPGGYELASLPVRVDELQVVSPPVIAHFHARGMPVHAWTVDAEDEMRALLAMGADGLVTDRPDLLRAVLDR